VKKKPLPVVEVKIEKLVHGGQGLGVLPDGRKVFVWNALPGETLQVQLTKQRKDYAEGIAQEILRSAPERTQPFDEAYLSTSPWQIMEFATENAQKQAILQETFAREKVAVPEMTFVTKGPEHHYRNKMEYSFWADDHGLHLALYQRGTHGKQIVAGSSIARPEIDEVAGKICTVLQQHGVRGSQLKTVVLRCNQAGEVVAALFAKDKDFPVIKELQAVCKGITVCFSNPKSPASVVTKELYAYGDLTLRDTLLGKEIAYDVHSFFQVNVPVFVAALEQIQLLSSGAKDIIDLYSGVGTIGIPVGASVLVELDPHNVAMAKHNAAKQPVKVVHASTEQALEYITPEACVIVDPPRAGLHPKVVDSLIAQKPAQIIYLSCNPVTQARDLAQLQEAYTVAELTGYNFFPRTPHIESLVNLVRK